MSAASSNSQNLLNRLVIPLFAVWLGLWIVIGWGALQDDAFIHLRYADFLHRLHFITYDGVHLNYGTSSLLWVGLLAILRSFTTSPFLPTAFSTFFLVLLFVSGAIFYLRSTRTSTPVVQYLALCFLTLLVAPSGVRWLSDGMETGLVLFTICTLVWWTHRLSLQARLGAGAFVLSTLFGVLLVFLRTELLAAAAFVCAILSLAAGGDLRQPGWFSRVLRAIPSRVSFLLGAVLGAIAIRLMLHNFLPDTALAKSSSYHAFFTVFFVVFKVLSSAMIFGLGMMALWIVSGAVLLRHRGVRVAPTLMANAVPVIVLILSGLRGQVVQGARHVAWIFFFAIVWNFLELRHLEPAVAPQPSSRTTSQAPASPFIAFLLACLALLPLDVHYIHRVLATRVHTFQVISSQNLGSALHGKVGLASDVGFISYFSQGEICDMAGLVNGRALAATPKEERLRLCAARHPNFAFLHAGQVAAASPYLDMTQWKICGEYNLATVSGPDRHYLLVEPSLVAATCQATGFTPKPFSDSLISPGY